MAFANKLAPQKPVTAAEHYDAWLDTLPDNERTVVVSTLAGKSYGHKELKQILETDEDYPAPRFGVTAFREWRSEITA